MSIPRLLLCASQDGDAGVRPYTFHITNINVYSFEEALYHCYAYWKQSLEDFLSDAFIQWVGGTLHLSYFAARMREINAFPSLSRKLITFLSLTDYFSYDQLEDLRKEIALWEDRNEWEKYKERGDYLLNRNQPEKALVDYRRACGFGEKPALLNNMAIALMKLGRYAEAAEELTKAIALAPGEYRLRFHLLEALILSGDLNHAEPLLQELEAERGQSSDILYYQGELNAARGQYMAAIRCYEQADQATGRQDPMTIYRLSDTFIRLRLYERALEALDRIENKDKYYLIKMAEVHVKANNVPAAIKCIEKALAKDGGSVDLWTRLAEYYRLDYDLVRANSAIGKALGISAQNERANLEQARIKKAMGKIKDYQIILHGILNRFKAQYRETEG